METSAQFKVGRSQLWNPRKCRPPPRSRNFLSRKSSTAGGMHVPSGSPLAFKSHFGWVLAGTVCNKTTDWKTDTCYYSTTLEEKLRLFWETEDYNLQQPVLSLEERTAVEHFEKTHSKDESGWFIVPLPSEAHCLYHWENQGCWKWRDSNPSSVCWEAKVRFGRIR